MLDSPRPPSDSGICRPKSPSFRRPSSVSGGILASASICFESTFSAKKRATGSISIATVSASSSESFPGYGNAWCPLTSPKNKPTQAWVNKKGEVLKLCLWAEDRVMPQDQEVGDEEHEGGGTHLEQMRCYRPAPNAAPFSVRGGGGRCALGWRAPAADTGRREAQRRMGGLHRQRQRPPEGNPNPPFRCCVRGPTEHRADATATIVTVPSPGQGAVFVKETREVAGGTRRHSAHKTSIVRPSGRPGLAVRRAASRHNLARVPNAQISQMSTNSQSYAFKREITSCRPLHYKLCPKKD